MQKQRKVFSFIYTESCYFYVCHKRLEAEKVDLISKVSKMHNEQGEWNLQKSELEMSLTELNAENTQLRSRLQSTKV